MLRILHIPSYIGTKNRLIHHHYKFFRPKRIKVITHYNAINYSFESS